MGAHKYVRPHHSVVSWTMEQSSCIFSVIIAGFPVLDSAIGNGFLAATKQLYEWFGPSVCPSVCPSHLFDYVPIVITNDRSNVHAKGQGQRSRSQRSQPHLTLSGL